MSLFGRHFRQPERLSPDEARRRRFVSELERQRKVLEAEPRRLSPANLQFLQVLRTNELRLRELEENHRAHVEATVRSRGSSSRSTKRAISDLLQVRRERMRAKAKSDLASDALKFAAASAAERRAGMSTGYRNPRSIYGTEALSSILRFQSVFHKGFTHALTALPCIQRAQRREVLFARNQAKGHRGPHRRGRYSDIWC